MYLIRHGQSQFNAVFSVTRQDPGIADPDLTEIGIREAHAVAERLLALRRGGAGISRLIASPYARALQTAVILADKLEIPVTVDARVRERAAFTCDVGVERDVLQRRYPQYRFDHLDPIWWHDHVALGVDESEAAVADRAAAFRAAMARESDWRQIGVVTHYGFIRGLTGRVARNGEILRLDIAAEGSPAVATVD